MKKIIGIVLATIIMLSTLGILPASADYLLGGTYEYADRNECEEKYNISYYTFAVDYDDNTDGKITSVQELTDVFSNDEEILSKYDEEFFQDKFLYRIGHNAGDTSYSIRVTAVSSEKGSVEILLSLIQEDKGGDMVVVPWTALVELDRSLIDQNVLIKEVPFSYSYAAGISYYNQINLFEYDEWNYLEDPVPENRRKLIKSYAELTSFIESATYLPTYDEVYQGVISNYDDDFFEDKFLLFVNWKYCDGSSLDFGIAYDRKNGNLTSIKIAEVEKPSDSSVVDMECDWLIVLELDSSLLDEEFNLTMQTERGNEVGILSYPSPERVTLNPDLYTELTTDEVWEKMGIQVLVDIENYTFIIKDRDDYYKAVYGYSSPYSIDMLDVCDVDGDGEYELLFTTNTGSGILRTHLWSYSKSKEVHCSFGGVDVSSQDMEVFVVKNNDGSYNLNLGGDTRGKLAIEQKDDKYWLTVTYPEGTETIGGTPLDTIELLSDNRLNSNGTSVTLMTQPPEEVEPPTESERMYNISYYTDKTYLDEGVACKITSYAELSNQFPNCEDILSKYNEAFFEDKFLYRVNYHAPNPAWDVRVTDIDNTQDSISIEVTVEDKAKDGYYYPDVIVPWDILFEFDNSYLTKTISSKIIRDRMMDTIYEEAFGQSDALFVKMTHYPNDKIITVGNSELYYNSQKNAYFGIVNAKDVDVEKRTAQIAISNGTPQSFTYGNLVANSSDEANISDLHAMKLIIEKNILPDEPYLLASDLNGDGQCNISDLQAMKQYIEMGIDFPVLN